MTRQVTDQLYIDLGYLTPEDYYTYQADAVSEQVCEASVTCDASVIVGGEIIMAYGDLPSFATISCTISHIEGADLFAFTEAALSVQAEVIRLTNVDLSTTFNVAVDGSRAIVAFAQADAFVDVYAESSRTRDEEAAMDAAFSTTINIGVIKQGESFENSLFSPSISISILKNSFAVLDSVSSLSANSIVTKGLISNLDISASFICSPEKIKDISSNLEAIATVNPIYGSFTNKRPHSVIVAGISSPYGLTTAQKKFGTHSFYSPGDVTVNKSLRIQYSPSGLNIVSANQDFYISSWIYIPSVLGTVNTSTNLISGNGWRFGYFINASATRYAFFEFYNGSTWTRVSPTIISSFDQVGPYNGYWAHFEAFRSGSTITFRFDNGRNGVITATTTYSNIIRSNQDYIQLGEYGLATVIVPAYFDELYIAIGVSQPQSYYPDGSIADGSLSTTKFLFHFDGNYYDELTGLVQLSSNLQSTATVSAIAGKSVVASSTQTSTSSISCDVTRVKQQSADLQSEGFLVSAFGRIRPFVDIGVAEVSLSASASVTKPTSAILESSSSVTCEVTKVLGPVIVNSTCNAELTATPNFIFGLDSNLIVEGFVVAAFGRIRPLVEIVDCVFTLSANPFIGKVANAELTSTTQLDVDVTKQIGDITASYIALTSLTASAVTYAGQAAQLSSSFNVITDISITRDTQANLQVTAFELVIAESGIIAQVDINVNSTLTVDAISIQRLSANIEVTSQLNATINEIYQGIVLEVAAATLNVDADVTRDLSVNLTTSSTLISNVGIQVSTHADLVCQGFVLSTGRIINLLDTDTYIVPADNNYWQVPRDINLDDSVVWVVPQESTNWVVSSEHLSWIVESEDRTYFIKD